MNNAELDQLLKSAPVPERASQYWEEFPESVSRRLRQARSPDFSRSRARHAAAWAWGLSLGAVCIVVAFVFGFRQGRVADEARQFAALQKVYREVSALFPNQLQAIIIDEQGPRLVLAEMPNVPSSDPLLVKICQAKRCRTFITFSGQQIRVNGEVFDVLADGSGQVILAGRRAVWTSAQPMRGPSSWNIEARPLKL